MTDDSISEVQMYNTPDRGVTISPVGTEPKITYRVNWEQMSQPSPKLFHDFQDVQITLATRGQHIKDETVKDAHDNAIEAINNLIREMVEARADAWADEQEKRDLYMGNLDVLPEVEKEVTQVEVGDIDE